ncbi:hypothetical protein [Salarchaeum japonicum]|uniref:hypothetical protein n=1 Tax=Salarchaeum japonicum TaxID=555573 RepID=UPI003C7699EB
MALLETLSVLSGVGGLSFGAYQYYRAKSDEKRKQELNDLADELNDLRRDIDGIVETFQSPTTKVDLSHQLDYCTKDVLAYKHETGDNALVKAEKSNGGEKVSNAGQALDLYKNGDTYPRYHLTLESGYTGYESNLVYAVSDHAVYINHLYKTLDKLQERHKGTLEEFSPGLYDGIEGLMDDFVEDTYTNILSHRDGIKVNPDSHNNIEEMGRFLFFYFWHYEGITKELESLSQLSDKIEEARTTILQASY